MGDALGGPVEGNTPAAIQQRYGGFVTGHRRAVLRELARRPADVAVPQGRRSRHRRHVDDARPRRRVRRGARPPRRLRHRRATGPAVDEPSALDPRAGARDGDPPAHLPRREVARRPPALRPRRPAGGRGRQHRQLRSGDVHDARRDRQRRRPGGRLRRGDRHGRRPPVELRARGGRRVRRRRRRGDAPRGDGRLGGRAGDRRRPRRDGGSDRSGRLPSAQKHGDWRERTRRPPRRRSARSTRSAPTIGSRCSTPASRAGRSRSKSSRSPSASSSCREATTRDAVLGGVNYGRDADSIATMAGAITGALGGAAVVPPSGSTRCRRRAGSTSTLRQRRWPPWRGRSGRRDAGGASRPAPDDAARRAERC